jgi:uncharacterized YigZ family protein
MSLPDSFYTISHTSTGEFKERGSKFLSYAFSVQTEEEAKDLLKQLRKEHYAAAHVCWALVLGCNGEFEKSSDDREPSGTAGKPILRAILEKKMTFTLIAVVRYFGGKLLGVPGLIQAYGEAAKAALTEDCIGEKKVFHRIFQPCSYELQHEIIRVCKHHQLKFFPDIRESVQGITFEVSPGKWQQTMIDLQLPGLDAPHEPETIYAG